MATVFGTSVNDVIQAHGGGPGSLAIVANGAPAGGGYPVVNVWINGVDVMPNVTVSADHSAGATQQITVPIPAGQAVTSFAIEYTNDLYDYTLFQDRNLYLSSVTLDGVAMDPTLASYARTLNGVPFDTVQGQADMIWGGTMTFSGAQVQNAGSGQSGGGVGNVTIDGGAGIDTVVYQGSAANFAIAHNTDGSFTVSGGGNTDTMVNVERLHFSDMNVAIDVSGDGGMAYRLYQAAFDRAPDLAGLGFQISALDGGWGLSAVAQNFINSPEFQSKYGALNDTQFVTQLYANVLHRAPDDAGLAFHVNDLQHGLTRADVLAQFSESPENQAQVIGAIQNGMHYTV